MNAENMAAVEKLQEVVARARGASQDKARLEAARDSMRAMERGWHANIAAAEKGRQVQARLTAAEAEVKRLNVETDTLKQQLRDEKARVVVLGREADAARAQRRRLGMTV